QAGAGGAFVFPMHEPDGYPPANDMVLEAAARSDGLLVPFCRVAPAGGKALDEARRALDAGARGIKLHPRAEQFTLDHPAVRELAALADERHLPMLVHAGRGIPALGAHMVELAAEFPSARFILAHAGITDLAWLWQVAPSHPNLLFDSSWWIGPDLQALFSLVPPGQIVFASDAPYGHTLVSALAQLRIALQAGLSREQIRLVFGGQSRRIAARLPLQPGGPAVGERDRPARTLLERVATFTILGALAMLRGDPDGRGAEQLALARLACNVPEDLPEAPVFDAVLGLLDAHAVLSARDPASRRPRVLLMLASSVARSPDVPLPVGD
ncbi:MAG TPA: amidohydrolase family protein, partial [Solirubrobacteraceae bacterium]|nr:amidohydrolase family protein [Solirubrobacteraceae bacterium]